MAQRRPVFVLLAAMIGLLTLADGWWYSVERQARKLGDRDFSVQAWAQASQAQRAEMTASFLEQYDASDFDSREKVEALLRAPDRLLGLRYERRVRRWPEYRGDHVWPGLFMGLRSRQVRWTDQARVLCPGRGIAGPPGALLTPAMHHRALAPSTGIGSSLKAKPLSPTGERPASRVATSQIFIEWREAAPESTATASHQRLGTSIRSGN